MQQNAEREKVQAQIAVTLANAKANAVRAEAQANADATMLNGEAQASNIKLTGEARAAAIEARAKALGTNPNLVTLVQAERWNGVLPTTMVPGSAVPFVSIKQDLDTRATMPEVPISGIMEQMPQGSKMERNPARRLCEAG